MFIPHLINCDSLGRRGQRVITGRKRRGQIADPSRLLGYMNEPNLYRNEKNSNIVQI